VCNPSNLDEPDNTSTEMLEMDWHWIKVGKKYRQYCKVSGSLPPHQKNSGNAQKFQGRLPPHPKKQLLGMSISFRAAYPTHPKNSGNAQKFQGSLPSG
jgi:hypothetical protein